MMTTTPTHTSVDSLVEIPSPEGSSSEALTEDEISTQETSPKKQGWFSRMFANRSVRRGRDEKLATELEELKENYAKLREVTEDIREIIEQDTSNRQAVHKALNQFPKAVSGISDLQTQQREAKSMLSEIREGVSLSTERDERAEQTSESMLMTLRKIEKKSHLGIWLFVTVFAILFIALIFFGAEFSQFMVPPAQVLESTPLIAEPTIEPAANSLPAETLATE